MKSLRESPWLYVSVLFGLCVAAAIAIVITWKVVADVKLAFDIIFATQMFVPDDHRVINALLSPLTVDICLAASMYFMVRFGFQEPINVRVIAYWYIGVFVFCFVLRQIEDATTYPYGMLSTSYLNVVIDGIQHLGAAPRAAMRWCYVNRVWFFDGLGSQAVAVLATFALAFFLQRKR